MTPKARRVPSKIPQGPLIHVTPWGDVLEWQLPKLMAIAGYRFATQLYEALKSEGIDLSYSHIHRLTQKAPERLTVDVQFALCRLLNCRSDALWINTGQVVVDEGSTAQARQRLKTMKPIRARGLA